MTMNEGTTWEERVAALESNVTGIAQSVAHLAKAAPSGDDGRIQCARTSPEIGELLAAMAAAQGAFDNAKEDRENPAYKSKYADLGSAWNAVRGPLAANGLTVMQIPRVDLRAERPIVRVSTILGHKSGQWIETALDMPVVKNDPQGIGSATTYAKRYALVGILGIATGDDDDGNAASGREVPQRTPPKRQEPAPEPKPAVHAFPVAAPRPPSGDDVWATVADQIVARIIEAPTMAALKALTKDVRALPDAFRKTVGERYNQRSRELAPMTNGGVSS